MITPPLAGENSLADTTAHAIGVVQMRSRPGDVARNLADAGDRVAELAGRGARVIVLPELFATGYTLSASLGDLVRDSHRVVEETLLTWAREHDVVIATAVATEGADGTLADSSVIIGPDGLLATSTKRQLWGDEPTVFRRGHTPPAVASTPFGTIGVAICYEAGFPEIAREIALAGAEIIAVPAAFGSDRLYAWQILTRSRALENGCFVAAAGLAGHDADRAYAGHSCVVSPDGRVLSELGDDPGTALARVDLSEVHRARDLIPYLADLRRVDPPAEPGPVTFSSTQPARSTP